MKGALARICSALIERVDRRREGEASIRLDLIRQCVYSIAAILKCAHSFCARLCFIWGSYERSLVLFVQTRSVCLPSSCSSGPTSQRESKHVSLFIVRLPIPEGNLQVSAEDLQPTSVLLNPFLGKQPGNWNHLFSYLQMLFWENFASVCSELELEVFTR